MHADHAIGTVHRRRNLGDTEGRGVGGDDGVFCQQRCRLANDRLLDCQLLRNRLDQHVGADGGFTQVATGQQIRQGLLCLLLADLAQAHAIGKDFLDTRPGLRQCRSVGVHQQRNKPGAGERMCNAGTHQAGTDDDYFFLISAHVRLSFRLGSFC
ncbi:hypothetical protein D3C72_1921160 [compost metagenome]